MGESELDILYWDNPKLSAVCEKIDDSGFGPQLEDFGRQLIMTMNAHNGIGLAAPQVGVLKRMFVMQFPDNEELNPEVVCNPALDLDGTILYEREGCLSLPGVFEQVSRASNIIMQYRDPLGRNKELALDALNARVAQHEFDHLFGIMFFNYTDKRPTYGPRMSKQVSKNVMRMWEKEKKRKGL